jgi:hypothetical protein
MYHFLLHGESGHRGGAMSVKDLLKAVRETATPRAWAAGVDLCRAGAVIGVSDDGDEVLVRVKARGKALPFDVYLWPDEDEWECTCELAVDACVHVCAGAISLSKANREGNALPEPAKTFRVKLAYEFVSKGSQLSVRRSLLYPDGRRTPLEGALAQEDVIADPSDVKAEMMIVPNGSRPLPADDLRRLVLTLGPGASVSLDGTKVTLSKEMVSFRVRVSDDGAGFRVALVRPPGLDALYRGLALRDGVLHPTDHGRLSRTQRQELMRGVSFDRRQVASLVGKYIPALREFIEVDVATERLPRPNEMKPQVAVRLVDVVEGLQVQTSLVYGNPPVARVEQDRFVIMGDVVPARDVPAERSVCRGFEDRTGHRIGAMRVLPPELAADFLARLEGHPGPVKGSRSADRFQVYSGELVPRMVVDHLGQDWSLDVQFDGPNGGADAKELLKAWSSGRSLVPLMKGGYGRVPTAWLKQHAQLLQELMESQGSDGRVHRHATAALVEMLEETDAEVPADLSKLRSFLSGDDGMEEVLPGAGFVGDLRSYQAGGLAWLGFLERMDLHGILADDMGLGKTVQTLAALSRIRGPHLVVAPTSVMTNWEREVSRFVPDATVNVFHGAKRRLVDADITLTTYALMRLDPSLSDKDWQYVVLDEAQAIKNPSSQTARAACGLRARHRLCLTGTPVENRLEELWSLFKFLMPGLLPNRASFKNRFERPIEMGDAGAAKALRGRVGPYVLRRMKRQVASELPSLTSLVMRCELPPEQRKLYETVRSAARADVQRAVGAGSNNTMHVLEALLRLRQVCCDPSLLGSTDVPAAKLDQLEDLLVELICDDHKALIFSQWTGLLDRVEPRLKALGIDFVRLDGSTRDRAAVVDQFQDPAGPPVFLISLKAGGTGLNLTAADYVIHLDPWWNPAVEQQATDRAHRIGQERPVVSCRLIAANTVEERVLDLQESKRAIAEAALGSEGGFLKALSSSELRDLFA